MAGRVVTGKLVRLACERHLRDLETGESRGLYYDEEDANRAIEFFGYLRQNKARWADQPFDLMPWQAFIVGSIFGWKRADGTRRFRTAFVSVARKNGKSYLAGGIGLYLLDFDGEPGAEIYSAATKRDQSKIVWEAAAGMARRTPFLRSRIKIIDSRANMHVAETGSKFEALSAEADSLDGLNVHGAILDELHAHPTRKMVDVLETAVGARTQPLFFYITTAGVAGESIYTETYQRARRVVEGITEDDSTFVYIAEIDDEDDWRNPAVYIKSNPSLGVIVQLEELIAERDKAIDTPGRQNAFIRLRGGNKQTEQVNRWLDMATWDEGAVPVDPEALKGRRCFAGVDLSSTMDLSALVLVFPPDVDEERWQVLPFFWLPADNVRRRVERDRVPYDVWANKGYIDLTPGNIIDYAYIRQRFSELAEEYEIIEVAVDPWNATQFAVALQEEGATVVYVRQGYASLTAPTKELEKLVVGRKLAHGGHPVLRWNASNVAVAQDPAGNIKPDKAKSTERIDGIAALVTALSRALVCLDAPSAYEEEDLLIL